MIELFYKGFTPSNALMHLKESNENYMLDSKNREIIPNLNDVYYLFKKEKSINFGNAIIKQNDIIKLKTDFNDVLKINYELHENNFIIALCTKKMLGSLSIHQISSRIICIDASGGMDRSSGHLFNLVIPGPVGALSVGMFITFSETAQAIEKGLNLLKNIWVSNNVVRPDFSPISFMSDDCTAQIKSLNKVFPSSRVLLCQFYIKNALWK